MEASQVLHSVIVPLYNEEESVELLYAAITAAMTSRPYNYELLFVNDGSSDDTYGVAAALAAEDPRLRVIEFRRNYGQTPAMAAGIDYARGDILITMDGDLQNDPSDIPMMLDTLEQGYDIVVGWRHNRQDKLVTRKIPSKIANWLIGKVTGVPIKDNGCSLKVYRASMMKNTPFYNEMHRFIPALLSLSGAKVAQVKVKHHARQFGESKYGLSRIYKVLIDLLMIKTILSLMKHPARWFASLAAIPFVVAMFYLFEAFQALALDNPSIVYSGMTAILISLSFFLMGLGLLCEFAYQHGDLHLSNLVLYTREPHSPEKNLPQSPQTLIDKDQPRD
jgi:glycosyltransferase involved in cell wall biosynthesis